MFAECLDVIRAFCCNAVRLFLAQLGHVAVVALCPLLGAERKTYAPTHEVTNVGSDRSQLSRMSEQARAAIGSEAIEARL